MRCRSPLLRSSSRQSGSARTAARRRSRATRGAHAGARRMARRAARDDRRRRRSRTKCSTPSRRSCVARRGADWLRAGVAWDARERAVVGRTPARAIRASPQLAGARFPADGDYVSEINPAAEALVEDIGGGMRRRAVLLIDYGFPASRVLSSAAQRGTLMCHYRHRAHADPFAWPGLTDITAHVDFTAMAAAGERAGLAGRGLRAAGAVPRGLRDSRRARGGGRARIDDLYHGEQRRCRS